MEACGFVCESIIGSRVTPISLLTKEQNTSQHILETRRYDVVVSSPSPKNAKEIFSYTLTSEQKPLSANEDTDLRSHRFRKNNDFYRTSVRSISNNSFFFPATGLYNFSCGIANTTYQCQFGNNASAEDEVLRIQTSRDRFNTSLLLAKKNATNDMFLALRLSSWTAIEAGKTSAVSNKDMNATCSDVYTEVCTNIPLMLFLCHCSSFLGTFTNFWLKCTVDGWLTLNCKLRRLLDSGRGLY